MNRSAFVHVGTLLVLSALGIGAAGAQETRAAIASGERAAKADVPAPAPAPQLNPFERALKWAYPTLGSNVPGSGWLSGGAGYRQHLFGDAMVIDGSAAISMRRYSVLQSTIAWPRLFSNRLSIAAQVKSQDFTQINYFGIGSETSKSAQADYRLRDVDVVGSATIRPVSWLALGGRAGYLRGTGVRPGLSSLHPSVGEQYDETTAPGLTAQPRYAHGDAFVEADSRDVPGYPTRGGVYRVGLASFRDLDGSPYDFRRVDIDAAQYVPLFHEHWIIALRSRVTLSQTTDGHAIPFYLLPTLGGGNTLRAYADYRFRDRNAALVSAEYGWPLFRLMDAALFVDAGTVAPTAGELRRAAIHRDYGFGVRLHSMTRSIARVDVARGEEGIRVAVSLSAAFGASRTVTPYVP